MTRTDGLLFGPHGAVLLAAGLVGLPAMVPGYNPMFQTVTAFTETSIPSQNEARSFATSRE
jgi:hypothetical protein